MVITAMRLGTATGLGVAFAEAALRAAARIGQGDVPELLLEQLGPARAPAAWRAWLQDLAGLPGPMPDRERLKAGRPARVHRAHGPAAAVPPEPAGW